MNKNERKTTGNLTVEGSTNAYEAFQAAVRAIRKQGVKIAQNLRGDCSCDCYGPQLPASWGDHELLANYAYTTERVSKSSLLWDKDMNGFIDWSWRGLDSADVSTAQLISKVFREHGFPVLWNGLPTSDVSVEISAWSEVPVVSEFETMTVAEFTKQAFTTLVDAHNFGELMKDVNPENYVDADFELDRELANARINLRNNAGLIDWSGIDEVRNTVVDSLYIINMNNMMGWKYAENLFKTTGKVHRLNVNGLLGKHHPDRPLSPSLEDRVEMVRAHLPAELLSTN